MELVLVLMVVNQTRRDPGPVVIWYWYLMVQPPKYAIRVLLIVF